MRTLRDYSDNKAAWITFVEGNFYPDSADAAIPIFEPVLEQFGALLRDAADSCDLLRLCFARASGSKRIQLLRVFRKYVSPDTAVEMLKRRGSLEQICRDFGSRFRELDRVRQLFLSRPQPDTALIAVLNEYRDRGQKGYTLTGTFFEWFETNLGQQFDVYGPTGAGRDLNLSDWLTDYPKASRPVDIIITAKESRVPLVIGLARYDSDRGGAQEDDRTSGYRDVITEVLAYSRTHSLNLKLLLLNDGPGLLLGSMWRDYCDLEDRGEGLVIVSTLKMLNERLTSEWILW